MKFKETVLTNDRGSGSRRTHLLHGRVHIVEVPTRGSQIFKVIPIGLVGVGPYEAIDSRITTEDLEGQVSSHRNLMWAFFVTLPEDKFISRLPP